MRKSISAILLLIALVLSPSLKMMAAPVTPERAMKVAGVILNDKNESGKNYGALQIVWTGNEPTTKADDNPPFYVVASMTGGFVIVAGDDNVRPVLAVSERNVFHVDDMPDNVKWWMDGLAGYVRSVTGPSEEVDRLWASYLETKAGNITGTVTDKVEHLTPEWNQGNSDPYYFGKYVFNKYCPVQDGTPTVTGCVATAMAEILTVHSGLYPDKMPAYGVGEVGGYLVGEGYLAPEAYSLGTVYDWAGLRTLTNIAAVGQASEALQDNLARLMADCGAMVQASYSVSGTGAGSYGVINGAIEHLGYNKGARIESPGNYSKTQWERMLMEELNLRPMYYAGNGHAFVFDGYGQYDGDPVFHVNFGWGGSCNGYYYYYNLDTGSSNYSSDYGDAIFNFYPDPDSDFKYCLALGYYGGSGITGPEVIPIGESFTIVCREVSNIENGTFYGTLRVNLADKNGTVKVEGIGSCPINGLQTGWYYSALSMSCVIPSGTSIAFGDKLVLECTTDAEGTVYGPVEYAKNGRVVGELPLMPEAFICKADSYSVGDYFDFQLQNFDKVYAGTIWTVTYPSGQVVSYPHSEGMIRLTSAGTYTIVAEIRSDTGGEVIESVAMKITVH